MHMLRGSFYCPKKLSVHFVAVLLFILFNYYILVFEFLTFLNQMLYSQIWRIFALVIFHISFFMLVWSMVQAITTDPGRVPIYWGFFEQENNQNDKKRYCLLCHGFKPERCHHCSTCQRCVLNMDHHCPWICNCVGYFNRKFFILFLVYVILTLIIALFIQIPLMIIEIKSFNSQQKYSFHTFLRMAGLLTQLGFLIIIIRFFQFHLELVMTNSTTLDNLQRQRNPSAGSNVYNIGSYNNFTQVFGTNVAMWFFPIFTSQSKPSGNGVTWQKDRF